MGKISKSVLAAANVEIDEDDLLYPKEDPSSEHVIVDETHSNEILPQNDVEMEETDHKAQNVISMANEGPQCSSPKISKSDNKIKVEDPRKQPVKCKLTDRVYQPSDVNSNNENTNSQPMIPKNRINLKRPKIPPRNEKPVK